MSIMNLQPGAMVMALKDLDSLGADVKAHDVGVVFAEKLQYPHSDGFIIGPCVRWIRSESKLGGVCNVYDGDVMEVKSE